MFEKREYKEDYNAPLHFALNIDPFKTEKPNVFKDVDIDNWEVNNDN